MATEYTIYETKKEWLQARTKCITSTEIAALFNCERSGQYGKSLFELWHEKKNQTFEYTEGGNDARKGLYFEPAIAKWFADIHELAIVPFDEFAFDPDTRQGASFDYQIIGGYIGETPMNDAVMEIKTAKYSIYKEKWIDDKPPAYIEFQVQMQLKLSGLKYGVIVLFVDGDFEPRHWIIEACPDIHKAIDIKCAEFWKSIDEGAEPEPDFSKDADFVIGLNQDAEGVEDASEEQINLALEYMSQKKVEKANQAALKSLKAQLFASTDAEVLKFDDTTVSMKQNKNGTRVLTIK